MNRIDTRIADATLALDQVIVSNEWSIDEWRGQLVNAKALQHEIDSEALESGRCVHGLIADTGRPCRYCHETSVCD